MGEINIFESLRNLLVFDDRDWGANPTDAWLYGIIKRGNDRNYIQRI